jgi:predicted dehydrogenase
VLVSQISHGRKNAFSWEVAGSTGTLAWAQETPETLWLGRRDPDETRLLPRVPESETWPGTPSSPAGHPEGWADAWRDLFRPFYRAIAGGAPPPASGTDAEYPTLRDGARAVRFVEAVLASNRTGGWVELG